jgi:filamentous hemagglutinin
LEPGLEVKLNGIRFDGCREEDGTMLEAKGPGYATFLNGQDGWRDWFTSLQEVQDQMEDQARAAAGRVVEWHFAEPGVADYFRAYAQNQNLTNVVVIYTPVK